VTEHRNAGDTCSSGGGAVGDTRLLKHVTVFLIRRIFEDKDNIPRNRHST